MSLSAKLAEYIRAAFSGLYVVSFEPDDALADIARLCRDERWRLAVWDIDRGLALPGTATAEGATPVANDPLAAIKALPALAHNDGASLLILRGFHRLLGSAEIVQALEHQLLLGKVQRTFILILAPIFQLPTELERLFVVVEHDLPDRGQLAEIARGVASEPGDLPEGPAMEAVLDAAAGLTRHEAENSFSLSIVRHGRITPDTIWDLKSRALTKSGLLQLHRGSADFSSLGGLKSLKAFCKRSLLQPRRGPRRQQPRGVLLLGVPGTGKSAYAKALGHETNRPTLILDIGALLGSLVGQTEANIRHALKIADAMSPCILFCDEIEKALAGSAAGSQSDSGVGARLFGTLLTWLNDHESDVYFVGTCNDISKLPPELARAERFDGIFFLDLPGREERIAIWEMYLAIFGIEPGQKIPADEGWTGAEIRACCRLAALLDVPLVESARNIVPVSVTAAESVERLRSWASGRCLSAESPGVYTRDINSKGSARRRLSRDASNN